MTLSPDNRHWPIEKVHFFCIHVTNLPGGLDEEPKEQRVLMHKYDSLIGGEWSGLFNVPPCNPPLADREGDPDLGVIY